MRSSLRPSPTGLTSAKQTLQTHNSLRDTPPRVGVAKAGKPILEQIGLPDFEHVSLIDDKGQFVNYR